MQPKAIFLRFTSTTLLATIVLLTLTGLYGLMWPMPVWMYDLHRISAWALVGLIPWKGVIIWGSLRRGFDRRFIRSVVLVVSLLLAVWTLSVIGLALFWSWRAGPERLWWYQTAVSWHWYLALGLLVPLLFHAWQKWPRPRKADFTTRRGFLKLLGLSASALGLWGISAALSTRREDPERPETPSGSREEGSFSGLDYPVNMMVGEGKHRLSADTWTLAVRGAVKDPVALDYAAVLARPAEERIATLDCTDGWFTTQVWRGCNLRVLLAEVGPLDGATGFILRAASGYSAYFLLTEADDILLATHSGGIPFDHWHGFPLRAVVPSRRGWQWVKWVVEIVVF